MLYEIIGAMSNRFSYCLNGGTTSVYYSHVNGIVYNVHVHNAAQNTNTRKCLGKIEIYQENKLVGVIVYDGLRQ